MVQALGFRVNPRPLQWGQVVRSTRGTSPPLPPGTSDLEMKVSM